MLMSSISLAIPDTFKTNRYQQGRQIALQAAQLLREKYHLKQVILFGSLLSPATVRRHSDIDLAVCGLSDQQYYLALNDLLEISPDFSFDLIQLESAQPSLQAVINRQGILLESMPFPDTTLLLTMDQNINSTAHLVLLGQIQQELIGLNELIQKNEKLLTKLKATQDEDYIGTLALNLHSFYTGVERIFKQIAQTIDGSIPDTPDWHRQLLRQMSAPVPSIRPPILDIKTRTLLDDYCSFRHVVRNIYSFNLRIERVEKLSEDLSICFDFLQKDLQDFMEILA